VQVLAGSPAAITEFATAFYQLIEARREDPRDDLLSAWVHASVDGEALDIPEIIQEGLLLLDGSAETTRSVIGQTVSNLARFPDQREILLADPAVIGATAVDEFIRYATPILNMRRTVTVDHQLHGCCSRNCSGRRPASGWHPAASRSSRPVTSPGPCASCG
jgi:cholest-4-en-3-one 26-monooxygenase